MMMMMLLTMMLLMIDPYRSYWAVDSGAVGEGQQQDQQQVLDDGPPGFLFWAARDPLQDHDDPDDHDDHDDSCCWLVDLFVHLCVCCYYSF